MTDCQRISIIWKNSGFNYAPVNAHQDILKHFETAAMKHLKIRKWIINKKKWINKSVILKNILIKRNQILISLYGEKSF